MHLDGEIHKSHVYAYFIAFLKKLDSKNIYHNISQILLSHGNDL